VLFGPSRSPNIALFERFQRFFPNIDQHDYKPLDDLRQDVPSLQHLHAEVTSFLKQFLAAGTGYMPREDYKEMIELCLLILSEFFAAMMRHTIIRIPGAYHHFSHKILSTTQPPYVYDVVSTAASSRSQHTLFTLCHSDQTIIIAQSHSSLFPTCFTSSLEPASYITQDSSSELFIPSQRPSFEHAGLTCYTLLSPSITFSLFHSELKTTFSENLILYLISLFLSVGLILWL